MTPFYLDPVVIAGLYVVATIVIALAGAFAEDL